MARIRETLPDIQQMIIDRLHGTRLKIKSGDTMDALNWSELSYPFRVGNQPVRNPSDIRHISANEYFRDKFVRIRKKGLHEPKVGSDGHYDMLVDIYDIHEGKPGSGNLPVATKVHVDSSMCFVKGGDKKQRQSHRKGPRKQPTKKKTKKRSRGTIRKRKRRTRKRQRGASGASGELTRTDPDRDVRMKIACVLIYMSIDRLLKHKYADARLSFTRCIQFLESVQETEEIDVVPPGNVVIPVALKGVIQQFFTVLAKQAQITSRHGELGFIKDTIQALSYQGRRRECEVCMPIPLLMLRPEHDLATTERTANRLYLQSMQMPENFTNISKYALQLLYGLGDTSDVTVGPGGDSEYLRQTASDLIVPITERTEKELNQLWTSTFTLIMTGRVPTLQGIPVSVYPPKYFSYELSERLGYLLFHFMSYRIGEIEGNIQEACEIYDNYHYIVVSMNSRRPTRMLSTLDGGGPESALIDKCMKFRC